jgi:sugar phosphate permease
MSLGGVVGSALIPPVNTALIGLWGWNHVWWLWAALLILFFIPIVYLFLYDKPEDLGLRADNCTAIDAASKKQDIDANCESFTIKEAMRYKSFWGMLFCQMLLPLITTGIVFHFISIAGVKGLSETSASFILSLLAIVSFPATLAAGYLLDRIKMHYAAALMCSLQLASLLVLLLSASIVSAVLFAVIQGTAFGLQSVCSGVIWPNYFGTKHIASIRGLSMAALVIGSALGPIPFGFVFDASGNYNLAIVLMMVLSVIGVGAALLSPKPVKKA